MTMQAMPMMMPMMPAQAVGPAVAGGKPAIGDDLFGQLLAETGLAAADLKAVLATLPAVCRQKLDLAVPAEAEAPVAQPQLEQALTEEGLLALLTAETTPSAPVATGEPTDFPEPAVAAPEEALAEVAVAAAPLVELAKPMPATTPASPATAPEVLPQPQTQAVAVAATALAEAAPAQAGEPTAKTVPGHLKKEMDQRFARLLQPQAQEHAQARPLRGVQLPQPAAETAPVATEAPAMPQPSASAEPAAQLLAGLHRQEGRSNPAVDSLQPALPGTGPQPQATMPQAVAAEPMLTLASGRQLPEAALVQQVVTHLSGSPDGESGKMVLRLKPAELGELKIDLVMEGDKLKAHLHAQSQQVQEVLERHLPQLRDALQQKGLQMDDFRVSVDSGRDQGQFFQQQARQEAPRAWGGQGYRTDGSFGDLEEVAIPLYRAQHPGGISLHV